MPCKSCDYAWILDQPGLDGLSSRKTKNYLIASRLLWEVCLYVFYLLLHREYPNPLRWKRLGQTYGWSGTGNWTALSVHFPPGFSLGIPCQQNGLTEIQPLWRNLLLLLIWPALFSCITYAFFVEALVPTISGTWYEYLFRTIVSVPPRRGEDFYSSSSNHSDLVHISKSLFCRETPVPLRNFAIFLPVILVNTFHILINFQYLCLYLCLIKFHLLRILQYFCLQFWFLNSTSW